MKEIYEDAVISHDFHKGVQIDRATIAGWHKELLEKMSNDPEQNYSFIASGNSLVLAHRNGHGVDICEFTSGYMEYTYTTLKQVPTNMPERVGILASFFKRIMKGIGL